MMFYTNVSGWMLQYFFKTAKGDLSGLDTAGVADAFRHLNTAAVDFSAARREVLAENVSDFIVQTDPAGNGLVNRPREITLTVAVFDSPENYQAWRKAPTAAFRQAHEQRYVRKVVFDDVEILHDEVLK